MEDRRHNGERAMQQSHWDVELDTRPWAEVEAWHAQQIAGFVPQLALRSEFYNGHLRSSIGRRAELGIKKFMSGGEPGLGEPEIRAKISRAWNTSHIRECMGIGDVMSALWGECDDASGIRGIRDRAARRCAADLCARHPASCRAFRSARRLRLRRRYAEQSGNSTARPIDPHDGRGDRWFKGGRIGHQRRAAAGAPW